VKRILIDTSVYVDWLARSGWTTKFWRSGRMLIVVGD